MTSFGRILFLSRDPARVREQLAGRVLAREQAGALRDEISTDEITPLPALVHFDAALGRHAHTGFSAGGELPIGRDALQRAGIEVLVAGSRYGKGSSREHSPLAELSAGVRLVIAESFERIYRQNADNLGLLTSTDLSLVERLQRGDAITLDGLLAGRESQAAAILRAGGLLAYGLGPHAEAPSPPPGPKTLFQKIVERHALKPGFVHADRRFIHEIYTGMCAQLLQRRFGPDVRLHDPGSIVCFEDHHAYVARSPVHLARGLVGSVQRLADAHRDFVARHDLVDHGLQPDGEGAQGISHALMAERYALPGELIVGTDSHTPHSGALGCVAFGVGTTEMANAFMTGAVRFAMPEVLRIEVDGRLPPGASAKDLVLHLLALPAIRAGAGVGRVFEFGGAAVRAMNIDERATLTNMTAELGGFTGIVEPDEATARFLRERRGVDFQIEPWMHSDSGACYADVIRIDAGALAGSCRHFGTSIATPCGPLQPAVPRFGRCASASSAITTVEARRERTESARLVSTMGTRAPSTMPALSAPARYCSCLAIMLPASRSGASRMLARPATLDSIFLVRAASSLTALSKASGPSSKPPVIWPRSAILHRIAASTVLCMSGLTVSTAARMATRGSSMPSTCASSMAFCAMSALSRAFGATLMAASVISSMRG